MLGKFKVALTGALFVGLLLVGGTGSALAQEADLVPQSVKDAIDDAIAIKDVAPGTVLAQGEDPIDDPLAAALEALEAALGDAIDEAIDDSELSEAILQYAAGKVDDDVDAADQGDFVNALINGSVLTNPDLSAQFGDVLTAEFPDVAGDIETNIAGALASIGIETAAGTEGGGDLEDIDAEVDNSETQQGIGGTGSP